MFIARWLIAVVLCLGSSVAWSQEGVRPLGDTCAFDIVFPSMPESLKTCNDDTCINKYIYTSITDMQSSLSVTTWCVPVDDGTSQSYDESIMVQTVLMEAKDKNVTPFDTEYNDYDTHKVVSLIGQGQSGAVITLYMTQLWIGGDTAFVIQAETIGDANDALDKELSEILKSITVRAVN